MSAALSEQQFAAYREIAAEATNRPLVFSDCEGVLKVWALSALEHVARDQNGEISGWSEPGSYAAADLVAEVELGMGTWDPGEDMDDDQRRRDIGGLVAARDAVPALLAEVERLRAERDVFADRVDTLTSVAKGNKRNVQEMYGDLLAAQARITVLEKALAATGRSLSSFIFDSSDPGTDALAAQWLYQQALPGPAADDPFADAHRYRAEILHDAAKRQRVFIDSDDYVSEDWEAAHSVVDLIDPDHATEPDPTDPPEYRYCGAILAGRTEWPRTCHRRIGHDVQCGPQADAEGGGSR